MKSHISKCIVDSVKELGKNVTYLSNRDIEVLYSNVVKQFIYSQKIPFWEYIDGGIGVHDKNGWSSIEVFLKDKEFILFTDPGDEKFALQIYDAHDLSDILSNTIGFQFYVTDFSFLWMVCFNDHDNLIVKGEKVELWLLSTYDKDEIVYLSE